MKSVLTRKATIQDVPALWKLRQESILALAPQGMTIAQSKTWAAKMTLQGMERRFHDAEIWIAESNDTILGWIAFLGDYLDGLYIKPQFADQGIGTELLNLVERLMRQRGIKAIRLEASLNAEQFYLRRGFKPTGDRAPDDAIPMAKQLSSD
jgi:putative acetyltransferase